MGRKTRCKKNGRTPLGHCPIDQSRILRRGDIAAHEAAQKRRGPAEFPIDRTPPFLISSPTSSTADASRPWSIRASSRRRAGLSNCPAARSTRTRRRWRGGREVALALDVGSDVLADLVAGGRPSTSRAVVDKIAAVTSAVLASSSSRTPPTVYSPAAMAGWSRTSRITTSGLLAGAASQTVSTNGPGAFVAAMLTEPAKTRPKNKNTRETNIERFAHSETRCRKVMEPYCPASKSPRHLRGRRSSLCRIQRWIANHVGSSINPNTIFFYCLVLK